MRVVLPSNASLQYFPHNTLTNYTAQLAQEIKLPPGEWEVGLSEISFNKSWYNVMGGFVYLSTPGEQEDILAVIQSGYYSDMNELTQEINNQLKQESQARGSSLGDKVSFQFNNRSRRVSVRKSLHHQIKINVNGPLRSQLGFSDAFHNRILYTSDIDQKYPQEVNKEFTGDENANIDTISNIYVYSDVVQNSHIGDVQSRLLRIVPVNKEHWAVNSRIYQKIQYLPVSQKNIRNISIYLRTDTGEKVPFTAGKTVVTLQFRPVKA